MTHFGKTYRHLKSFAHAALFVGCLSLLMIQQIGRGAQLIFELAPLAERATQTTPSFSSDAANGAASTLSTESCAPTCEAILSNRRLLIPSFRSSRSGSMPLAITVFHGNARPVLLRTRAVFCDFSLLRSVLHPHFCLLENSTTILC